MGFVRQWCLLMLILGFAQSALAWGERGHHALCAVATRLVAQQELTDFLKSKDHMLGHVCNIPDIYWRDLGPVAESGDDTHFMNFENVEYTPETTPLLWSQVLAEKEGKYLDKKGNPIPVEAHLGSSWWRYEQFYKRAVEAAVAAKAWEGKFKEDPKKENFNKHIFAMITNMGLMGHFVGDASQPFHNTTDYDGWNTNQGGIHSYYESGVVKEMGLDLEEKIYKRARQIEKEIRAGAMDGQAKLDPVRAMRFVTTRALKDIEAIRKADKSKLVEPSRVEENPADAQRPKRYSAKRLHPSEMVKPFERLIINQMASSALVLAMSWDALFVEGQSPLLKAYSSYKYPLSPDFVAPSYGGREPSSLKKKAKGKSPRVHHCEEHATY